MLGLIIAVALLVFGYTKRASGESKLEARAEPSPSPILASTIEQSIAPLSVPEETTTPEPTPEIKKLEPKSTPQKIPPSSTPAATPKPTPKPAGIDKTLTAPKKVVVPDDYGRGAGECVKYARHETGIEIMGDANTWLAQAKGKYETSTSDPFVGGVVVTDENIKHGHVGVVTGETDQTIQVCDRNIAGKFLVTCRELPKNDPRIRGYISSDKVNTKLVDAKGHEPQEKKQAQKVEISQTEPSSKPQELLPGSAPQQDAFSEDTNVSDALSHPQIQPESQDTQS